MRPMTPIDQELFEATRAAVAEAHDRVRALQESGKSLPKGHKVPDLSEFDCGLPSISTPLFDNVIDYGRVFGPVAGEFVLCSYDELPALQRLIELARTRPRLRRHLLLDRPSSESSTERDAPSEMAERLFKMGVADLAHASLDRLLHTIGDGYSDDDLLSVYCLLERGLLAEQLPVEVVVPVALTKFDAPEPVVLGKHARLEPLSEDLQKARAPESLHPHRAPLRARWRQSRDRARQPALREHEPVHRAHRQDRLLRTRRHR
jgi:hypothetical protein